jgi:hypothetical protein
LMGVSSSGLLNHHFILAASHSKVISQRSNLK